ncbi:MAG: hypothetical protein ACNA8L_08560 [Luteolibacter sp.]
MSKTNDQTLIIPGERGWEIWTRQGAGPFILREATQVIRAADIPNLPSGDLLMCFPVKAVTALPMKVASDDDSLFDDLATLHAERLGLRPDPMAGQLTDLFVIGRENESAILLEILLRAPREGEMPQRGPTGFDISPRALDAQNHALILWKEFGRWVFSIHSSGKLLYCQATSNDSEAPDAALAREIRLALIQLEIQGIHPSIPAAVVWSENAHLRTREFATAMALDVSLTERPVPAWPAPSSSLLPADVRTARREAAKKRTLVLAGAAAALAYLGVVGWLALGVWRDSSEIKRLSGIAEVAAPEGKAVRQHYEKWDELALALDLNHDPVDILSRIHRSIPPNSGLRLRVAEISEGQVKLQGEAPQVPAVQQFSLALNRNNELAAFTWQNPEPNQSARGWEFNFSATTERFKPTR